MASGIINKKCRWHKGCLSERNRAMYGSYYGYSSYDILFFGVIVVFILGIWAQSRVKRIYREYSSVGAASGISAAQMAACILRQNGSSVQIAQIQGTLTDNYNPRTGVVSLSQGVYGSSSVAALAIAAHELGHVMQHETEYLPIKIRNMVLPVASIGSSAAPYITILGVIMGSYNLAMLGVWLFLAMLIFQVVTLPVELNASSRGLNMLMDGGYISSDQQSSARKVLSAAAATYVVAALSTLISFLRLLTMAKNTRRNR